MTTAIILAAITLGLPICIIALSLYECWQHQRELDRAESDFNHRNP